MQVGRVALSGSVCCDQSWVPLAGGAGVGHQRQSWSEDWSLSGLGAPRTAWARLPTALPEARWTLRVPTGGASLSPPHPTHAATHVY